MKTKMHSVTIIKHNDGEIRLTTASTATLKNSNKMKKLVLTVFPEFKEGTEIGVCLDDIHQNRYWDVWQDGRKIAQCEWDRVALTKEQRYINDLLGQNM